MSETLNYQNQCTNLIKSLNSSISFQITHQTPSTQQQCLDLHLSSLKCILSKEKMFSFNQWIETYCNIFSLGLFIQNSPCSISIHTPLLLYIKYQKYEKHFLPLQTQLGKFVTGVQTWEGSVSKDTMGPSLWSSARMTINYLMEH